jgi:hypothetical protein
MLETLYVAYHFVRHELRSHQPKGSEIPWRMCHSHEFGLVTMKALHMSSCHGYCFCELLQWVVMPLKDVFTSDDTESNMTTRAVL